MKRQLRDHLLRFDIDAEVRLSRQAEELSDRTWLALTSSHLGKSSTLHREVCRYIGRSMLDARAGGMVLVVASGSAIKPWAERAAELYGVPLIRVHVDASNDDVSNNENDACILVRPKVPCSRDTVIVAIADRVDCVFARPKGNIEKALRLRLQHVGHPSLRVAVHHATIDKRSQRLSQALMGCGAIGWYCRRRESTRSSVAEGNRCVSVRGACGVGSHADTAPTTSHHWVTARDEWLVHCTRTCDGPWPGQTDRQHRDELLLGESSVATAKRRTPLDSLRRIVRMRRIVGSAITSDHDWPVVCFSQTPLATLLSQRCYRPHLHRWDYEPYGIAIRKKAAIGAGFQPVIYGAPSKRMRLDEADRYRFQAVGNTYDWTNEREWRCAGDVDLDRFDPDDIRLFVADVEDSFGLSRSFATSVVGDLLT
ncbi:MAG: hypothetical protein KDB00_09915 [Planctomycetales bacterium]|nr:hypothetical protein [Planctomycetales bacterium]